MTYEDKLSPIEVYKDMKFERDFDVLARTAMGEARGSRELGTMNVIYSILNRVKKQRKEWGLTVRDVCLKKSSSGVYQYSYWGNTRLQELSMSYMIGMVRQACHAIESWAVCGGDPTNGATHYHAHTVYPDWAVGHKPCFEDDLHKFYNDIR